MRCNVIGEGSSAGNLAGSDSGGEEREDLSVTSVDKSDGLGGVTGDKGSVKTACRQEQYVDANQI